MAFSPNIEELKNSLINLAAKIKAAAAKVRPNATLADNATTIDGQNITAVRTQLGAAITAHIADVTGNPHQDTAASVGIPLKTFVDEQLAKLIPSGVLPLSRFGSLNYLPVGIGGSYESGTHIGGTAYMRIAVHLEQDGTLVYLRNATDGSTQGVYYSYLQNAKTANISKPVLTNRRYRPGFIPTDMEVKRVYCGNGGVVFGEVVRIADGGGRQLFFSVCNDTFDDTKHTGGLIPLTVYNPSLTSTHQAYEPLLVNGVIYCIVAMNGIYTVPAANECAIEVVSIKVSELITNTVTALTKVTGWTVTGAKQTRTNQPNILIASKVASANPDDDSLFTYPATGVVTNEWFASYGAGAQTRSFIDKKTGKFRTTVNGIMRLGPSPSVGISPGISFSLVIDPAAKTAVLDDVYKGGADVSFDAAKTGLVFTNRAFLASSIDVLSSSLYYSGKNFVIADDGYAFVLGVSSVTEQVNWLRRSTITPFTTAFDFVPGRDSSVAKGSAIVAAVGPSPFMNGYRAFNLLQNGYITAYSKGTGTAWLRARGKYANPGETPNFLYPSIGGSGFQGYAPKSDRKLISALPGAVDTGALLTEMTADAVTSVTGGILSTATLSRALEFNENMVATPGSVISITSANSIALGKAAYTAAGFTGTPKDIYVQLVVPSNPLCMSVVTIWATRADNVQCTAILTATTTARKGDVGAVTVGRLVGKYDGQVATVNAFARMSQALQCGSTIMQMTGGFAYTISGSALWQRVGGSPVNSFKFFLNTDGTVEGFGYTEYTPDYNAVHYFCMPGLGIGTVRCDGVDADYSTKLQFAPSGKNKQAVVNWKLATREEKIVILSQQAPVGWNIYFTDPTPLFMAGNAYTVDVTSIDLLSITPSPANKKFYIYVQLVLGVPQYQVRETEINDSETTIYIGYVTTNNIIIDSIVVSKVDRIGTFRISTTPVGSAIPISTGHPADTDILSWT